MMGGGRRNREWARDREVEGRERGEGGGAKGREEEGEEREEEGGMHAYTHEGRGRVVDSITLISEFSLFNSDGHATLLFVPTTSDISLNVY